MAPYYPKLAGEKCYLSPCTAQDGELWARWLNDLAVAVPLGDEAYQTLGLERMQEDAREAVRRSEPIFTIVEKAGDTPIGRCLLFGVDSVNRSANVGIFIGEKAFWNQGYGQEALILLIDYGFNLLNLHSIMLGVFSFNRRAIQAYHKIGFREIGRRRESRILAGRMFDVIFMDLLEDEFRQIHGPSRAAAIEE